MPKDRDKEEISDSDEEATSDIDHEAEAIALDQDQDEDDPDSPNQKKPKKKKPATLVERISKSPLGKQVLNLVTGFEFLIGALKSFRDFTQSFRALLQEMKKKEPEATYKQRLRQKAWICVKDLAAFTAYTASVVSIVAAAIAAVGNPFGLAISMGILGTIAAASLTTITASIIIEKFADKKISIIKKSLRETEDYHDDLDDIEQKPSLESRLKAVHKHAEKRHKAFMGMTDEYETHGHKNPALFLMKHLDNHPGLLLKAEHHLGPDTYKHIAESTLKLLKHIKDDSNPIYQGIDVSTHTMPSDPQALLVTVPRITEGTDGATEDHIRRFKDHHGIQIRMNADPSDAALCLMMTTVAQGLGPLKMRPGASVLNILRALEAAKLAHPEVTLKIDPKDRARIEQAEPEIRDYFHAVERLSAEKFKAYVEKEVQKHGERTLGAIPDEIPRSWKQSPQNTK